jgi:hypothetical protein
MRMHVTAGATGPRGLISGGLMASHLEGMFRVGGGIGRTAALTPQARRYWRGRSWRPSTLFALLGCRLVMYGMVMVAVMRRELGLCPRGR